MKIVINKCFGGFGLSHDAIVRYCELKELPLLAVKTESSLIPYHYYLGSESDENYFSSYSIERNDPVLVQVVEEMGKKANGFASQLAIVNIPDGISWHIAEYDGHEHVAETHRTWS